MIIIQESLLETVYLIETGFNKLNENKTVVLLSLIELYLYYTLLYYISVCIMRFIGLRAAT